MIKWLKNNFWLICIVFFGGLLRLISILNRGPFRFDEMQAIHYASFPIKKFFSYLIYETNPMFSFLFWRFWVKIFGPNEFWTRFPSLCFGLGSIISIYQLGKYLFNKKVGLFTSFLTAIIYLQVFIATEVKAYALIFLLSTASVYCFFKFIEENNKKYFLWYLIISAVLIHTHLSGWLVIFSQNIFFFLEIWRKKYQNIWKLWILGQIILLIILIPWFVPWLIKKAGQTYSQNWYTSIPFSSPYILNQWRHLVFGQTSIVLLDEILFFGLIFLLGATLVDWQKKEWLIWQIKPTNNSKIVFLFLWLLCPTILMLIFEFNHPLFLINASPALYLLITYGLEKLKFFDSNYKTLFCSIFVFLLLISATTPILFLHNPYQDVSNFILQYEKQDESSTLLKRSKILVHVFPLVLPFQYYYRGNLPVEGFYPLEDKDDLDLRLIKKNWQQVVTKDNVNVLNNLTSGYQRIFLVYNREGLDPENLVYEWFLQNNWHLVNKKTFSGVEGLTVFIFEKY